MKLLNINHKCRDENLRTHPKIIELLETNPELVNDKHSELEIYEIPQEYYDYNCYEICEYDGKEYIKLEKEKYKNIKIKEILYSNKNNDEIVKLLQQYIIK